MFFGCSDVDAHVPEARVRESAAVCERMGAKVTTKIYPGMGHLVNDDEIAHAQALLDSIAVELVRRGDCASGLTHAKFAASSMLPLPV